MKKFQVIKRTAASFLICLMLSFSAFTSYLASTAVPVQAASITTTLLPALIEAIMASMGLSFSSTTDLNNAVTGLDGMMDAYPDYTYKGVDVFTPIKEALQTAKLGTTITLPYVCAQWLCEYLYNFSSVVISKSSDVISPSIGELGIDVTYGDFSEEFWSSQNLFLGKDVFVTLSGELQELSFSYSLFNKYDIYTIYSQALDGKLYYHIMGIDSYSNIYIYPSTDSFGDIFSSFCSYDVSAYCVSYVDAYESTGSKLNISGMFFTYDYNEDFFRPLSSSFYNSSTSELCFKRPTNFYKIESIPVSFKNSNISCKVYIRNGTKFYNSYDEWNVLNYSSLYAPTSAIYGATSSAKSLETDEEDEEKLYVPLSESSLTSKVENAVNNALAENPSITEEELNAVASDMVAVANGIKEAIGENTGAVEESNSILRSILLSIDGVAATLENMFVLDFDVITEALGGFTSLWEEKLPFVNKLPGLLDGIVATDSYNYPVIKMKTPDILSTFYEEEYIVLCDFAEYEVYILWVRNLLKVLLWFSFFLYMFKEISSAFIIA